MAALKKVGLEPSILSYPILSMSVVEYAELSCYQRGQLLKRIRSYAKFANLPIGVEHIELSANFLEVCYSWHLFTLGIYE